MMSEGMMSEGNAALPIQRHLDWQGCFNVRDLGGLPAAGGASMIWRAVVRADLLGRLTSEGQAAMLDYGVRTVIDLRSPQEVQAEPSVNTAQLPGMAYLNLPLERYEAHVSALIEQAKTRGEVYCIMADHYPDMFARVMEAIAGAQPGGVVIHCHAGKDRTGIVAALLLTLAGVPAPIIAADYAESQARLWPLYEQLVAQAGGEENVGFWLKPTVVPEMVLHFLTHLKQQYGSVEGYLSAGGLAPGVMARLKLRLAPNG